MSFWVVLGRLRVTEKIHEPAGLFQQVVGGWVLVGCVESGVMQCWRGPNHGEACKGANLQRTP